MGGLGLTLKLMSLGGLAFSVGMVVDASIVITENIRRHFAEHRDPALRRQVTIQSVLEVAGPATSFNHDYYGRAGAPVYAAGNRGKMFMPLALTMIICMFISLIVALTIVPVLSEIILKQSHEKQFRLVRRFHESYLNFLGSQKTKARHLSNISYYPYRSRGDSNKDRNRVYAGPR